MECATRHIAWQPDIEVLTQRMSLPPKTHFPWILCHRNTLCQKETVNHLMNTLKTLTLTHSLAKLLEQFCQLKDKIASLKSTALQSIPAAELSQISYSTSSWCYNQCSSLIRNHCTKPCSCTWIPCTQHRESMLTTIMLQDIPTFDDKDSSKIEDWFMDIETTTGILT